MTHHVKALVLITAIGGTTPAAAMAAEAMAAKGPAYQVQGEYYETCACRVSCPCPHGLKPSADSQCDAIMLFHIAKGKVGKVPLDGINLAGVIRAPKDSIVMESFEKGVMDFITFYMDDKATPEQREAIGKLMPALFGDKEIKGMKPPQFVPMKLDVQGDNVKFEAGAGKIAFDIDNLSQSGEMAKMGSKDKGGKKRVTLMNAAPFPFVAFPTQGQSKSFTFNDYGLKWRYEGRNAFFSTFSSKGKTK